MEEPIKIIGPYRYYINRCLGEGSFGKVYQGFDQTTKQKVAVKKIDFVSIHKHAYIEKSIKTEIKIISTLKNEHIVQFKDILSSKKSIYIITQLCVGGDLKQLLQNKDKLKQQQAQRIIIHILKGFSALLQKNIIHRDIKPANILIKNDIFKICDFSFSLHLQNFDQQMMKSIVGSPLYMAPQLLLKTKYTSKCDIWSIGVIWYQMLVGSTPWFASNQQSLLKNIRNKPISYKNVPKKAQKIICQMLKFSQQERISWQQLFNIFKIEYKKLNSFYQKNPNNNNNLREEQLEICEGLAHRHFICVQLLQNRMSLILNNISEELLYQLIFLLTKSIIFSYKQYLKRKDNYYQSFEKEIEEIILDKKFNIKINEADQDTKISQLNDRLKGLLYQLTSQQILKKDKYLTLFRSIMCMISCANGANLYNCIHTHQNKGKIEYANFF